MDLHILFHLRDWSMYIPRTIRPVDMQGEEDSTTAALRACLVQRAAALHDHSGSNA